MILIRYDEDRAWHVRCVEEEAWVPLRNGCPGERMTHLTIEQVRPIAVPLAVFAAGLAAAAACDLKVRRIPNAIVGPHLVAGLAYSSYAGGARGALTSLGGFAIGIAILFVPFMARLIGAGDVKLLGSVGSWLGVGGIGPAALLSAALTGVLVVALVTRHAELRRQVSTNLRSMFLLREVVAVEKRPLAQTLPIGAAIAAASLWVAVGEGRFPGA